MANYRLGRRGGRHSCDEQSSLQHLPPMVKVSLHFSAKAGYIALMPTGKIVWSRDLGNFEGPGYRALSGYC